MRVVLLESVPGFGKHGDILVVKDGLGRNFLIPKGKAIFATPENIAYYEGIKDNLRQRELERADTSKSLCDRISGHCLKFIMQASEDSKLYGSISAKDIYNSLSKELNIKLGDLNRSHVKLDVKIKEIGLYDVEICPHHGQSVFVKVAVGRSEDEVKSMISISNAASGNAVEVIA